MTPAARHQTAIEILDSVLAGAPAEQALTRWARSSRYAGSKDRAAVRDIVFDALRKRASAAARGGSLTGRGLVLGLLALCEGDPESVFSGDKYGPEPLNDLERRALSVRSSRTLPVDVPEWIVPEFEAGLGTETETVLSSLRERAPVFLRVNSRKAKQDDALEALSEDGITAEPVPGVETALRVTEGARQVAGSRAFQDGLVEVQDASSQAAVAFMPLPTVGRILDLCAGGGGKSLAMAALCDAEIFAHDSESARMKDIPARAERAGCHIECVETAVLKYRAPFDLVLCDVPCSGTGAWRRSPDARWRFDEANLKQLLAVQRAILDEAKALLRPGGLLVYCTCSVLERENRGQIQKWLAESGKGWRLLGELKRLPNEEGDGFYCANLVCS